MTIERSLLPLTTIDCYICNSVHKGIKDISANGILTGSSSISGIHHWQLLTSLTVRFISVFSFHRLIAISLSASRLAMKET